MTNQLCSVVSTDQDKRDLLSDSHRDFLRRYIEFELKKQEQVSKTFLRERFKRQAQSEA
jgi:hypothetical protein